MITFYYIIFIFLFFVIFLKDFLNGTTTFQLKVDFKFHLVKVSAIAELHFMAISYYA